MIGMRDPEKLRVWHSAMDVVEAVYDLTRGLPRSELLTLGSQVRRSAVSVPSNIAEGCGRRSKREFAQYLATAAGSLNEVRTQVLIIQRTGHVEDITVAMKAIDETSGQLVRLRALVEGDLAP
jgi:four helix bundle protein